MKPIWVLFILFPLIASARPAEFLEMETCSFDATRTTLIDHVEHRTPIEIRPVLKVAFDVCYIDRKLGRNLEPDDRDEAFTRGLIRAFHQIVPGFIEYRTELAAFR